MTPEKAIKLAVNDFVRELTEDENGNVAWYNGILAGASRAPLACLTARRRFLPGDCYKPYGNHEDPYAGTGNFA